MKKEIFKGEYLHVGFDLQTQFAEIPNVKKFADFYAKLHLFSTQYRKNRAKSLCFLLLTSMYKKLRSKLKY